MGGGGGWGGREHKNKVHMRSHIFLKTCDLGQQNFLRGANAPKSNSAGSMAHAESLLYIMA